MTAEVEQRIVEMRFENEQFERGAKQSLVTLEKLEGVLDILAEGGIDKIGATLDTVQRRFSTFGIAGAAAVQRVTNSVMDLASSLLTAIPNQIIGLEKARVDIDVKSLEEQASTVQTKIDTAESDMRKNPVESVDALNEQATTILRKIDLLNAEADRERIQRFEESKRAEADIVSKLQTRRKEYADKQAYIAEELAKAQNAKKAYDELGEEFAKVKAEQFDESQNVCKYCGQKLPENTQEENRKRFVKIQQERKDQINKEAIRYRQINRDSADNAKQAEESLAEIKSAIADLEHLLDEAEAKTKIFDSPVDASGSDEYKKLAADFALIKQKIADHEKHEGERQNKLLQIRIWREELSKIQNEIGMAKVNERINEQIEDLRQEQKDVAQAVANAEKILYQLSMVSMKKNETLTDEVNSHFTRVKFRLFRYLKNGETKDDCTPLVLTSDGEYRDATFSANTAAIVLAKLDIIAGLQKFYGVDYPVILDGAEALDSENSNIDVPYQLIMLKVTDDKELVIA